MLPAAAQVHAALAEAESSGAGVPIARPQLAGAAGRRPTVRASYAYCNNLWRETGDTGCRVTRR